MSSARCGLGTLSFCACRRSECSPPSGSQYRHLCGRMLLWACVRTLVLQGPGASAQGQGCSRRGHSTPAWTPIASPLHPPGSVLHRPCPDAPSWGGTRGSGREGWLFLSVDSLGGRSLSSFMCPDPGKFSGCPSQEAFLALSHRAQAAARASAICWNGGSWPRWAPSCRRDRALLTAA